MDAKIVEESKLQTVAEETKESVEAASAGLDQTIFIEKAKQDSPIKQRVAEGASDRSQNRSKASYDAKALDTTVTQTPKTVGISEA